MQLGVICERLVRNGVSSNEWSEVSVYKMNRIGPRTEPCGTPKLSKVGRESLLLMVTV